MTIKSTPERLHEFVRALAFLRREFLGRNYVEQLRQNTPKSEQKTIYFFDTDVIAAYCAPWRDAWGPAVVARLTKGSGVPVSEHFLGMGEIIPTVNRSESTIDDDELQERSISITSIITEHAIKKPLHSSLPLYQFSPQFSQTTQIFENSRDFAERERSKFETPGNELRKRIRSATALVSERLAAGITPNTMLPIVRRFFSHMNSLALPKWDLEQERPTPTQRVVEWERFMKLNALTGGIYDAKYVSAHASLRRDNDVAAAVSEVLNSKEKKRSTGYHQVLAAVSSELDRLRAGVRIEAAAEAIATLYELNVALSETEWRAVYVTGSRTLAEATYFNFARLPDVNETVAHHFSQKHVRHLFAFTTEALLEPDPDHQLQFINWLDGLLALESDPEGFKQSRLTEIIKHPSKAAKQLFQDGRDPIEIAEEVSSEWLSLTEKSVTRHKIEALDGLDSVEARRLQNRMLSVISKGRDPSHAFAGWDDLVDSLIEEYNLSKDRTFLNYSFIGTGALLHKIPEHRNPPDLYFETLENTSSIFRRLCDPDPYETEEFERDYKRIEQDCPVAPEDGDDRLLSHLRFLVLGATFASANKWGVALSQGKRAVQIVNRRSKSEIPTIRGPAGERKSFLSGREAYFLCAVATRVIAKSQAQLDAAESLLYSSWDALQKDREKNTAHKATLLRHKGEKLAISLSRYYLDRRNSYLASGSSNLSQIDPCEGQVEKIYADFQVAIDEIALSSKNKKGFTDPEVKLGRYGRVTLAHLATNVVQVATIQSYRKLGGISLDRYPVNREMVGVALKLMSYFADPPVGSETDRLRQTPLMRLYMDTGARLFSEPESFYWAKMDAEIQEIYKNIPMRDITEYDEWRYDRLAEFAVRVNALSDADREALLN